jgi:hypothetical protein
MLNEDKYKTQILEELRTLPEQAMPEVLQYLTFLRAKFFVREQQKLQSKLQEQPSHERTRQLLASSKGNWARDLIDEREDRL